MSTRAIKRAAVVIAVVATTSLPAVASAGAAPRSGVAWLKAHIGAEGFIPGIGGPNLSGTAETTLALEAYGKASARTIDYLANNIDAYVDGVETPSASNDDAGKLAMIMLVGEAARPNSPFHIGSLARRLEATQQPSGLFGASDASYDGTFRQALSLAALAGAGRTTSDSSVSKGLEWLLAQQCGNGGFSANVTAAPCDGRPEDYSGPDTNSTAEALSALAAFDQPQGPGTPITSAVGFLATVERSLPGWGWLPGNGADSNSTALVITGLRAVGRDVSARSGRWARHGRSPLDGLRRYQDRFGGFRYQMSSAEPDLLSSEQAVFALSGKALPF
jgi:hypothetical protein